MAPEEVNATDELLRQSGKVTVRTFQLHVVKKLQAKAETHRNYAERHPIGSELRLIESLTAKVLTETAQEIASIQFPE